MLWCISTEAPPLTPTPCSRLLRTVLCSSTRARCRAEHARPRAVADDAAPHRRLGAAQHADAAGDLAPLERQLAPAQLDEEPAARVGAGGGDGDIGRRQVARRLAAEDQQALHVARLEEDATVGAEPQHRGRRRDGGRRRRLRRRRLVAHDRDVAPQREALGVLAGVEQQPLARRRALDRRLDRLAGTHDVVELLLL